MRTLWRVAYAEFADDPLGTEGSRRFSARFHSAGHEVLYTAETESLARLERLVHLSAARGLEFVLLEIELPAGARIERLDSLPKRLQPPTLDDLRATRAAGDYWYDERQSLGLAVPSVLSVSEHNVLLARRSPQYRELTVRRAIPFTFDSRLTHARA